MKIEFEADDEVADKLVFAMLESQIRVIRNCIHMDVKSLAEDPSKTFVWQNLADNMKTFIHLNETFVYYGGKEIDLSKD